MSSGGPDSGILWTTVKNVFGANRNGIQDDVVHAVDEALAGLKAGNIFLGLKYLEYAQRFAPSNTAILFAIGIVRIAVDEPRAVEALELVADRTNWRDAIMHLALARHHFGNVDGATAELHRTLTINAPSKGSDFFNLASSLADKTGALGWCGLDNAGDLTVGGAVIKAADWDLTVKLDSEHVPLHSKPRTRGHIVRLRLPRNWHHAKLVTVVTRGRPLIGSPIQVQQITRLEGVVASTVGGIAGWCWLPGERDFVPPIEIRSLAVPGRLLRRVAEELYCVPGQFPDFAAPRSFAVSLDDLDEVPGPLEVSSLHGKILYGNPVDPVGTIESARRAAACVERLFPVRAVPQGASLTAGREIELREPSIPVEIVGRKPTYPRPELPRPIDIIIPVYRGLKVTMRCIESVLAARSLPDERIVVVVDASPDAELVAKLETLAARGRIVLRLQKKNRGFPATANIGLRQSEGRDVVLLNSDTLVPPGWAGRLQAAAYAAEDIGTATPFSNDATIFSYPLTDAANPPPDLAEVCHLAAVAADTNDDAVIDVPTGHGFCMYIRQECLGDTGVLREDVFGHGYGEENDFCMRARVFGWRHVAVPGLFVGHVGSQSFAAAKFHLIQRNNEILNRLHVGYDRLIQRWIARNPLAEYRRRIDKARFAESLGQRRTVALITHNRQGGVLRHVTGRTLDHEKGGDRAIMLRPDSDPAGKSICRIEMANGDSYPNLFFYRPDEDAALTNWLHSIRIRYIEFHHFIGHDETIFEFVRALGVPYDVFTHDYAWFCPRITLTNGENRYCGEPSPAICSVCVADHGSNIEENIEPIALRARSVDFLKAARSVIAPSHDTGRRMTRQLGIESVTALWEPERPLSIRLVNHHHPTRRKLCVVGAISHEKGYDILLNIARYVSRQNLPLELAIVGFTCDDRRLLANSCVSITGRYNEDEAVDLIRAQDADFGFLPALWPETWSYTLSQLWEANLPVVANDIGAPAERIRARGAGLVIPLHMPVDKLVTLLLHPRLFATEAAAVT